MLGFNYRMTDIQAAVGRQQLERLADIVAERRRIAGWYDEALAAVPHVTAPFEPEWARSNFQSYVVRLPDHCNQRAVMQAMLDVGISTRRGIMCAHREQPYAGAYALPHSEASQDRHIVLPQFPGMTIDVVRRVAAALHDAVTPTA